MTFGTWGLAFLAGLLSVLSPCVLPLLPLVFGAAAGQHRGGPVALAVGVALSFTAIGLFIATIGFSIGLDADLFRAAAAVLMVLVGGVLVVPALQVRLAVAGGPVSNWAGQHLASVQARGLGGQFAMGLLLGMVWSPCVGPTLGAASILAAQGSSLGRVTTTMLAFGVGAALPLVGIGMASRRAMLRWRDGLIAGSSSAKLLLGGVLIVLGLAIVSGFDRTLEAALVDASPAWLTGLTTRF